MVNQAAAMKKTIAALDLRDELAALVAYCEGLAEAIDSDPGRASLWREYRPAIEALIRLGEVEDDEGQAALLELVRTPVRDTKTA